MKNMLRPVTRGRAALVLVAAALVISLQSAAFADDWTFYTESNYILDLSVDPGGVWAATPGGAIRLAPDGTLQQHLTRSDHLPVNATQAIALDAGGDLWIGTIGGGAVRRLAAGGTPWEYGTGEGLFSGIVTAIQPVAGGVWVGTTGGVTKFVGDERLAEGRNRFSASSGLLADSVLAISEFGGHPWFGTSHGISELDPDLGFVTHLAGERVSVMRTDSAGRLVVGTNVSVYRWNTAAWETLSTGLPPGGVRDLAVAGDTLWAAVANVGVVSYDGASWVTANQGLLAPGVGGSWGSGLAIGFDGTGGLWLGTELGVARRVGGSWVRHPVPGIASNDCVSIGQDQAGGLWFSTGSDGNLFPHGAEPWLRESRGSTRLAGGEFRTFTRPPDTLASNGTIRVAATSADDVWIGTWDNGLSRYRISTGTFTSVAPSDTSGPGAETITDLAVDGAGDLWAAVYASGPSPGGLAVRTPDGRWTRYPPGGGIPSTEQSFAYPRSVATAGNFVWIGTYGVDMTPVIARIDTRGTPATTTDDGFPAVFSPSGNWGAVTGTVNDLLIDPDGTLWAATASGVARYDGGNWTTWNSAEAGQPLGEVRAITRDHGGSHWFATSSGLARLSTDLATWKTYTAATSLLPGDNVMAVMTEDATGDILISSWGAGVARLHGAGESGNGRAADAPLIAGPNPFHPAADAEMIFPELDPTGLIRIYSLSGRLVREIPAGLPKTWDGRDSSGHEVASGLYVIYGENADGTARRATVAVER